VVVGLAAEGRIARGLGTVLAGGGTAEGAVTAARDLVAGGARALISFGLAGALEPSLRPGALVIPRAVLTGGERFETETALVGPATVDLVFGGAHVLTTAADKRAAWRATGACAVDLESGAVARTARVSGLPFAVLRAICDPAERDLPAAAMLALNPRGGIAIARILASVLAQPGQLRGLLALAGDAAAGRRTLVQAVFGLLKKG
jgi:adenosylhomocysteine nucleosidase